MPTQPILFCDFDGVLCHDRFWKSLSPDEYKAVDEYLFQNNKDILQNWMRGKYTAEEINQKISENAKIPFARLWDTFVEDCKTMSVNLKALEKIGNLRSRFTVILITGNMDSFTRFTIPTARLDHYFDRIINSYEQGLLKSDHQGQIFIKLADEYHVSLTDCILIDDSKNINQIFSNLGGTSYLATELENILFHLERL